MYEALLSIDSRWFFAYSSFVAGLSLMFPASARAYSYTYYTPGGNIIYEFIHVISRGASTRAEKNHAAFMRLGIYDVHYLHPQHTARGYNALAVCDSIIARARRCAYAYSRLSVSPR